jgi:uridine kinase
MLIVGIAGGTGSGKTQLYADYRDAASGEVVIIPQAVLRR